MNSFESLICCSLYSARGGRTYYGTLILPSRKDKTCWQNCSEVQELSPSAGHQQLLFYSPVSLSSPANPTQPIYTCNKTKCQQCRKSEIQIFRWLTITDFNSNITHFSYRRNDDDNVLLQLHHQQHRFAAVKCWHRSLSLT